MNIMGPVSTFGWMIDKMTIRKAVQKTSGGNLVRSGSQRKKPGRSGRNGH